MMRIGFFYAIVIFLASESGAAFNIPYARIPDHTRTSAPRSGESHRRYSYSYFSRTNARKPTFARTTGTAGTGSLPGHADSGATLFPGLSARSFTSNPRVKSLPAAAQRSRASRRLSSSKSYMNFIMNALRRYERNGNRTELVRRLERILVYIPNPQDSIQMVRNAASKHKQKSRAEHRRIWNDIHTTKREVSKLLTTCETIRRNVTALSGHFEHHAGRYNNYVRDTNQKLEQIESHQQTQDLRYFDTIESTMNNTGLLSQLQKQIELQIKNLSQEKRTITRDLASIQRRLQIIFNQELNQQRSSLGQLQVDVGRQTDKLQQVDDGVTQNRQEIDSMTTAKTQLESQVSQANQDIVELRQSVRDTDKRTHELMLQTSARLDKLGGLQELISDLNATLIRNNVKERYLESRITSVERKLLRLNGNLIQQVNSAATEDAKQTNSVGTSNGTDEIESLDGLVASLRSDQEQRLNQNVEPSARGIMTAIAETGFEDRLDRMSRSLRHHNHKLNNVTHMMWSVTEDVRSLSITTSNYFAVINEQATIIRKQNETINALIAKFDHHEVIMATHLEYQHGTVMKLMTIVSNLARRMRQPIPQHKDCHDFWRSGHPNSGVYTIIKDMETMPVYCNMTESGGWTVIQKRRNGAQDFDKGYSDYERGFGSVYGEHWLGLHSLRWLTHGRMYSLKVLLEDWTGKQRYALYDKFMVFGQHYVLQVDGYDGNADDAMTDSNDEKFQVRQESRDTTVTLNSDCTTTRRAGWWFSKNCGKANPNGPYQGDPRTRSNEDMESHESFLSQQLEWMKWGDGGFALKMISMQIIPREALIESDFSTIDDDATATPEPTVADAEKRPDDFDDAADQEAPEEVSPYVREVSVHGQ